MKLKRLRRNPPDVQQHKDCQERRRGFVLEPLYTFSGVGSNWFIHDKLLNVKFINQWKTKPSLIPIFGYGENIQ
jgi:uncharacterized UPF0160 family protein